MSKKKKHKKSDIKWKKLMIHSISEILVGLIASILTAIITRKFL